MQDQVTDIYLDADAVAIQNDRGCKLGSRRLIRSFLNHALHANWNKIERRIHSIRARICERTVV